MSDESVENVLARDLEGFVKNEAFHWGDNATKNYLNLPKRTWTFNGKWYRNF
jgi:hypothetical protein